MILQFYVYIPGYLEPDGQFRVGYLDSSRIQVFPIKGFLRPEYFIYTVQDGLDCGLGTIDRKLDILSLWGHVGLLSSVFFLLSTSNAIQLCIEHLPPPWEKDIYQLQPTYPGIAP
jgi:hypothetical protein